MIIIKVINCDGIEEEYIYNNIDELRNEWSEQDRMPNIPMLDDELAYAEVDGIVINGNDCVDAMGYISKKYNWKY